MTALSSSHGAGGHIAALDGVRAASIILVVLTHTAPLGPKALRLNEMTGLMGMSLFFCLSGFLIVSILYRNTDVVTFLVRRVLRIVPAVLLYLVLVALIFGLSWRGFAECIFCVANYFFEGRAGNPAPLSHLWSLSVEMHFYLAIALLALVMGRRCVWLVPPAALVITGLRIEAGALANINTHLRVDEILSGGTLALVSIHYGDRIRAFLTPGKRTWGMILLATVLWAISCHFWAQEVMYLRPYFAALLVGVLVFTGKFAVYTLTGSTALFADAMESTGTVVAPLCLRASFPR